MESAVQWKWKGKVAPKPAAAVSAVRVVPGDRANPRDLIQNLGAPVIVLAPPKVDAPSTKYHDGTSTKLNRAQVKDFIDTTGRWCLFFTVSMPGVCDGCPAALKSFSTCPRSQVTRALY